MVNRTEKLPSLFRRGAEALRGGMVVQKNLIGIYNLPELFLNYPPTQGGEPFRAAHGNFSWLRSGHMLLAVGEARKGRAHG